MSDENILQRKRRVSLSVGEISLLAKAVREMSTEFSHHELGDRLDTIVAEESDPFHRATFDAYRAAVEVKDGEIEMDDDAEVSLGDDPGAYVMVWKWVSEKAAGIGPREITCERCGDHTNDRESPNGELCPDCYDMVQNTPNEDEESTCVECGMTYDDPDKLDCVGMCEGCADQILNSKHEAQMADLSDGQDRESYSDDQDRDSYTVTE